MKNTGELHQQFSGCKTQQAISARIAAMKFEEVRELMTFFGAGVDRVDLCVCNTLGIKYSAGNGVKKEEIVQLSDRQSRRRQKAPLFH